ncbi:hypothetical protein THTE_4287 [Thermogutta terrifontis]|uniref:Uncharacterized protein n=1 Tax=Thermogutta terrifontis TaxID=1331910 RepID=A0A286RLQ0_9BACT|nr:hypothetical protein THTE_4287 [Thermogutta terrifontis]
MPLRKWLGRGGRLSQQIRRAMPIGDCLKTWGNAKFHPSSG